MLPSCTRIYIENGYIATSDGTFIFEGGRGLHRDVLMITDSLAHNFHSILEALNILFYSR